MIKNLIVHRIMKEVGGDTTIHPRDEVLSVTPVVEALVNDILKLYNNKSARSYGTFKTDQENYPFSKYTNSYLFDTCDFVRFSLDSMAKLHKEIKDVNLATGGYITFLHYYTDQRNYVMVVMLNDKTGTAINHETLDINETIHLDMSKLHFAARVNVNEWQNNPASKYLSFIKGRGTDSVSKYFREFVGCDEYTDSKRLTERLVQAVKDFGDAKELPEENKQQLRKLCFDYCEKKRKDKEPVLLDELANHVWDVVPEEFLSFVNDEKYQLSSGFEPHRDSLRKLYRFSGREKGLSISFDSDLLDNRISYNKQAETLTINGLPQDLKRELDERYADAPTET